MGGRKDVVYNIQLSFADTPPLETQAGREQHGMKWDYPIQGREQPVSR